MIKLQDKSGRVVAVMNDEDQEPKFFDEKLKEKIEEEQLEEQEEEKK
jgi:hypothetical protein